MTTRGVLGALLLVAMGSGCGGPSCPEGQELCDGVCADVTSDRDHCGACGNACGAGEVCNGMGACALSCAGSLRACGGSCVDTNTDEAHCGSCGNACAQGELCDGAGSCASSCASGLSECSGACVDTDTDEAHCGSCGNACDAGESCAAGSCEPTCGSGLVACGDACVDPLTDDAFCGASGDCAGDNAGEVCGEGRTCAGGSCVDIHPCDLPTVGTPGVTVSAVSGAASEGGDAVTYTLVLDAQPCDSVHVTLAPDAQLTLDETAVVFTREDWDVPQTVSVRAAADVVREGDHTGTVVHTVASGDVAYDGLSVADVTVDIADTARLWHVSVPSTTGDEADAAVFGVSNGGIVAFISAASNLVADDTNGVQDVFLFDPSTGAVTRASVASDGTEANGPSTSAAISADGSTLAFFSRATNLTASAGLASGEFFRVGTGRPIVQITPACPSCASQEILGEPAISEDGGAIAFATRRTYLSDTDTEYDIFVWNEATASLSQESLNSMDQNGTEFWGHNAFGPTLSATGQFVGFNSPARNLAAPEITIQNFHSYVKDRTSRALTRVSYMNGGTANCPGVHRSTPSTSPRIARDGNLAVFSSQCIFTLAEGEDTNGVEDVLVRDIEAMTTTRVSVASDGTEADGRSVVVAVSDDGNLVLFWSEATNLVPDDTNEAADLFLRDIAAGTTTRVSFGPRYEELASGAAWGAMSRDGAFVAFITADNLVPSDDDESPTDDVYLVRLR